MIEMGSKDYESIIHEVTLPDVIPCFGEQKRISKTERMARLEYLDYERYNHFYCYTGKYLIERGKITYERMWVQTGQDDLEESHDTLSTDMCRLLNATLARALKYHLRNPNTTFKLMVRKDIIADTRRNMTLIPGMEDHCYQYSNGYVIGDRCITTLNTLHGMLKVKQFKKHFMLYPILNWLMNSRCKYVDESMIILLHILGADVEEHFGHVKYRGAIIALLVPKIHKVVDQGYYNANNTSIARIMDTQDRFYVTSPYEYDIIEEKQELRLHFNDNEFLCVYSDFIPDTESYVRMQYNATAWRIKMDRWYLVRTSHHRITLKIEMNNKITESQHDIELTLIYYAQRRKERSWG